MATKLFQRMRFAREQAGLTQLAIAKHFGIERAAVSQWESEKNPTRPDHDRLPEFCKITRAPLDWLLSDQSELTSAAWGGALVPMFSQERRGGDDETAVQIALESIAEVISRLLPSGAQELLREISIRAAAERDNHGFSPNHKLLGALSDIAQQARDDAEEVAQARRRGGSVRGTKRDTSGHSI